MDLATIPPPPLVHTQPGTVATQGQASRQQLEQQRGKKKSRQNLFFNLKKKTFFKHWLKHPHPSSLAHTQRDRRHPIEEQLFTQQNNFFADG